MTDETKTVRISFAAIQSLLDQIRVVRPDASNRDIAEAVGLGSSTISGWKGAGSAPLWFRWSLIGFLSKLEAGPAKPMLSTDDIEDLMGLIGTLPRGERRTAMLKRLAEFL